MTEKRIGTSNNWFYYGRVSGFAIGFAISKYYIDIQLGFWYIGLEY